MNEAVDDLRSLRSDDPVAEAAMQQVDLALLHLETDWLPLIDRIRNSAALVTPFGGPGMGAGTLMPAMKRERCRSRKPRLSRPSWEAAASI